jgi:hypothetical protein
MCVALEPDVLSISVGGYMGPSYRVRWEGGGLVYEAATTGYHSCERAVVTPSKKEWVAFWAALDAVKVREWAEHYWQPVVDGTGWSVEIKHGGWSLHCEGSNAYPPKGDSIQPSREFRRFCRAVSRLVGDREFA